MMRKLSHLYAVAITMIASSKCAIAPFEKGEIVLIGNTTIIDRPLIMSAWVPFNKNTHYWVKVDKKKTFSKIKLRFLRLPTLYKFTLPL